MKRGRAQGPRDQEASVFSAILARLCASSDAVAAALVDAEGETVDYAGALDPYAARIAAAELRLVLALAEALRPPVGAPREIVVRTARRSFAVCRLSDGYALVLVFGRGAFAVSRRALGEASDALEREAGLAAVNPEEKLRWSSALVREAPREHRPESVWHDGAWRPLTVLGRFRRQGLAAREIGYLARFTTGPELLLVREPLGKWFIGHPA